MAITYTRRDVTCAVREQRMNIEGLTNEDIENIIQYVCTI